MARKPAALLSPEAEDDANAIAKAIREQAMAGLIGAGASVLPDTRTLRLVFCRKPLHDRALRERSADSDRHH